MLELFTLNNSLKGTNDDDDNDDDNKIPPALVVVIAVLYIVIFVGAILRAIHCSTPENRASHLVLAVISPLLYLLLSVIPGVGLCGK